MKIKEIVERMYFGKSDNQRLPYSNSDDMMWIAFGITVAKETANAIKKDIETILNEIPTETESEAVKGVFYDRTAEEFKNDVLKKFEERKWLK